MNATVKILAGYPRIRKLNGVVRLRIWGDPVMMDLDGASVEQMGTTNFQEIILAHKVSETTAEFNAINAYQKLSNSDVDFLRSIQPNDGVPVDRKMSWMIQADPSNPPGSPYFPKEGTVCFGTLLIGGRLAQVETLPDGNLKEYFFYAKFRNKTKTELISFFKVIGMRRSQMGLISPESHPWLLPQWASAGPNNYYNNTPVARGIMYNPVWSPIDWNTSYGSQRDTMYLARAFTYN